jgi:peptidoglycan-associated lipoprotein
VNHRTRNLTLILMSLFFLVLITGCGKKKEAVKPTPPPEIKAVTAALSASPASIERGQSSTLTWNTENADQVTLDGRAVDANGSRNVSPARTTTFHLVAIGKGGTRQADATVTVTEPPAADITPPAITLTDEQIFAQNVTDIYFDYDRYDLRPQSQQALATAARAISQHPNWRVRIEGNCDDRGSTEYNLTLGENRARAAKDALIQAGVSADRLQTISYGKEKPACTEATEDCWQRNRRDHFVLIH